MASFTDIVVALAPPLGLATLFIIAIRAMITADRMERRAQARAEAQLQESRNPAEDSD